MTEPNERFKVIVAVNQSALALEVNKHMDESWLLYGNPFPVHNPQGFSHIGQAIVRSNARVWKPVIKS